MPLIKFKWKVRRSEYDIIFNSLMLLSFFGSREESKQMLSRHRRVFILLFRLFSFFFFSGKISKQQIPELLGILYHGNFPDCDAKNLLKSLVGIEEPTWVSLQRVTNIAFYFLQIIDVNQFFLYNVGIQTHNYYL